ncbi:MAG TPA: hypothetical protein VMZ91_02285, partial [Candidatus Paceibacterota bacterium]|nr:hypothetical protein [Candidatus Paceibacterota bacterium]
KNSDIPDRRSLAEIISAVTEIRSEIYNIKKYPYPKEKLIPIEYVEEMIRNKEKRRLDQYGGVIRDAIYTLKKLENELSRENLNSAYFQAINKLKQMLDTLQRNIFY